MDDKLHIKVDQMLIEVKIVNRQEMFGEKRFEVVPVAGSGSKWVKEDSLLKPADVKKIMKIK